MRGEAPKGATGDPRFAGTSAERPEQHVHRKQLKRYEVDGHARFLTCSCDVRRPYLIQPGIPEQFVRALARCRQTYSFRLIAWVLMPEHFHMVIVPDLPRWPVDKVMWGFKRSVGARGLAILRAKRTDGQPKSFWEAGGGYDRNLHSRDELFEKLRYIHWNPVKRGLVVEPWDWPWSSARWYRRVDEGPVPIDEP